MGWRGFAGCIAIGLLAALPSTAGAFTSADVSVSVSDSPDPVASGANVTYTIVVLDAGPTGSANITVTDTVPAGTTFQSETHSSSPSWTTTTPPVDGTGDVVWTSTNIPAQTGVIFTVVVKAVGVGPFSDTAKADLSPSADPNLANNSDTELTNEPLPTPTLAQTPAVAPTPIGTAPKCKKHHAAAAKKKRCKKKKR